MMDTSERWKNVRADTAARQHAHAPVAGNPPLSLSPPVRQPAGECDQSLNVRELELDATRGALGHLTCVTLSSLTIPTGPG